jgi:hypothetical protein
MVQICCHPRVLTDKSMVSIFVFLNKISPKWKQGEYLDWFFKLLFLSGFKSRVPGSLYQHFPEES